MSLSRQSSHEYTQLPLNMSLENLDSKRARSYSTDSTGTGTGTDTANTNRVPLRTTMHGSPTPLSQSFGAQLDAIDSEHSDTCRCLPCDASRCISHCWFMFACCGYVLLSSLPRLCTITDATVSVLMYLTRVRWHQDGGNLGVWEFIKQDFHDYHFRSSAVSVVLLALIRSVILFFAFAYRFQTNDMALFASTGAVTFSIVYVGIKMMLSTDSAIMPLLVFSLCFTVGEYALYQFIRRKRIRMPRRRMIFPRSRGSTYQSLDNHRRHSNSGSNVPTSPHVPVMIEDGIGINPQTLADSDSKFILLDRMNIHYKIHLSDSVAKNEDTIVMLHGFGGSVASWKQSWASLCKLGTVLAFDRPGFGLSARPARGDWVENPYTPQYQMRLTFRIMDELKIHRAVFVGHGSGASLAIACAADHPDRVKALMLISPAIYSEGFPPMLRSLFATRLGREIVRQLVRSELGEVALRRSWHHPKEIPQDVYDNYKKMLMVTNWQDALMEMAALPARSVGAELKKIACPVAVLHGTDDKLIPVSESQKAIGRLDSTNADFVTLPHCGHVPHQELPDDFYQCFQRFLRKRVPGHRLLHSSSGLVTDTTHIDIDTKE
jgi:pimeloyl-ACP methyl ester carboxylesterase